MKILLILLMSISSPVFADHAAHVKVKGMVCAFCVSGVKNTFKKKPEVKDIKVSLETSQVDIFFNEGKNIDDGKIKELVTGSGFNVDSISRKHQ